LMDCDTPIRISTKTPEAKKRGTESYRGGGP
jgi:hypothetical protein